MNTNKAVKIIEEAVERLLFGMGEHFPIAYVAQCDSAIKTIKEAVKYDEKTE